MAIMGIVGDVVQVTEEDGVEAVMEAVMEAEAMEVEVVAIEMVVQYLTTKLSTAQKRVVVSRSGCGWRAGPAYHEKHRIVSQGLDCN
jgi:hypothetical protein